MGYLGRPATLGSYKKLDALTFNGSTTTFTLTSSGVAVYAGTPQNLLISVNHLLLEPGVGFILNGNGPTITFADAYPSGTPFFGVLLGDAVDVGTVSNGINLNVGTINSTSTIAAANGYYERSRSLALGEWTSYTPVWDSESGTAVTVGNAIVSGRYSLVGKTVFFTIYSTFGSTSNQGAGNIWRWSLPFTAANTLYSGITAWFTDSGTQHYTGVGYLGDTSHVRVMYTGNLGSGIGAGAPITWASGDSIRIGGWYEAA